jgi:hypothetical protein
MQFALVFLISHCPELDFKPDIVGCGRPNVIHSGDLNELGMEIEFMDGYQRQRIPYTEKALRYRRRRREGERERKRVGEIELLLCFVSDLAKVYTVLYVPGHGHGSSQTTDNDYEMNHC